jgi:hypothetical protein
MARCPRAALAIVGRVSPTRGLNLVSNRDWAVKEISLHLLDDFRGGLDTLRRAPNQLPESDDLLAAELEMLGALGRLDDLERVIEHDRTFLDGSDVERLSWRMVSTRVSRAARPALCRC